MCAALLLAGCVEVVLPRSISHLPSQIDDLPSLEETDLSGADAVMDASGCLQGSLVVTGNATRVEAQLPLGVDLASRYPDGAPVVITVLRCRTLDVNGSRFTWAHLADVSVPVRTNATPGTWSHQTLALLAGNETVVRALDSIGLETAHAPVLTLGHRPSYEAQASLVARAPYGPTPFELSVSRLAPGGELPRSAAPALAWDRVVVGEQGPARLRSGFDVRETHLVVGEAGLPDDGLLGSLVPDRTARAHGYELRADLRMGVWSAG